MTRRRKYVARFQATNAVEITLACVEARMRSGPTSASEWHAIARALEAGARAARDCAATINRQALRAEGGQ